MKTSIIHFISNTCMNKFFCITDFYYVGEKMQSLKSVSHILVEENSMIYDNEINAVPRLSSSAMNPE